MNPSCARARHIAVVGAGMAGVTCARTLTQAGCLVSLFEQNPQPGGRMASQDSVFGSFDLGTQHFTAFDARFVVALENAPKLVKRWATNTVQMLDASGRVEAPAKTPPGQVHWVGAPTMAALLAGWAQDIQAPSQILTQIKVTLIEPDALNPAGWQLHTEGMEQTRHVYAGFDAVLLAVPAAQARQLLQHSKLRPDWVDLLGEVEMGSCWTLLLAFPQAMQPDLATLGPQWNAARASHHRLAWLARESSKPGRTPVERWTVQASTEWSHKHVQDAPSRVQAKLLKAFAEVSGIHAEPAYVDSCCWRDAKTLKPLGQSYLFNAGQRIGLCGDWCLGRRVETAFLSGLELALALL